MNERAINLADSTSEHAAFEEMLNLYLDGELPFDTQAGLFHHLAECTSCRLTFDSVLTFRRMSRQELLAVPPEADRGLFGALAVMKEQHRHFDRAVDRRPLWQLKTPISLRAATIMAVSIFIGGFMLPSHLAPEPTVSVIRDAAVEQDFVRLAPSVEQVTRYEPVYVFYPGLTVEAEHGDAAGIEESL